MFSHNGAKLSTVFRLVHGNTSLTRTSDVWSISSDDGPGVKVWC